jgi:hypothetical protein
MTACRETSIRERTVVPREVGWSYRLFVEIVPPPNPRAASDEIVLVLTEYGPRDASMLLLLGAGPRSYGEPHHSRLM